MNIIQVKTRLTGLLVISVLFVCTASAQNGAGQKFKNMTPVQRAQFQTGMMKSKLQLDTQQTVKVQDINMRYALKFQVIIDSDEGRFSKFREAKALQEKKDDELKTVFTPAQYKQYKDFEDDLKKQMMARANGDGPGK